MSGKPADVTTAKRLIQQAICAQITLNITIPVSVRPVIVGSGGKNLKSLTARTMTKISIPKKDEKEDDDEDQIVTITGDYEGVETARKEIEAIVAEKVCLPYPTRK